MTNEILARATEALMAGVPRAQADPGHPIFHVAAPAQWMNDPNGPIFFQGWYHLFYQLTPISDEGGIRYWGHVRSRDLVTWEHQPIALWPSTEKGEESIWSGCCTVNGLGQPMIFYTSITKRKSPGDHADQWAATSDDNLVTWQKSPANPVLTEALHGSTKINDWRDPFVFHDAGKTFLVAGGHIGGKATVNIYEAGNAALTQWKYRGVLFYVPDAPTAECPNFFKLGNEWVLFVSPYGRVKYYLGDFDADTCRFTARSNGLLDWGPNFYAPNTMIVPDGRRIVWGWVTGFPGGHGWNGCLSLPRLLNLSRAGDLRQEPAPQLTKLRGKPLKWRDQILTATGTIWQLSKTNTLEILVELDLHTAGEMQLRILNADQKSVELNFNGKDLDLMGANAPLVLDKDGKLRLRIFVDRLVMEVFANETVCLTKTIPLLAGDPALQILANGGSAKLIEAWPMRSIW
jgi:beta-fructofuranosidase